jgi:hypothetical protein
LRQEGCHFNAMIGADDQPLHCKGTVMSTCDADTLAELKHHRFRVQQQRYAERTKFPDSRSMTPAIKMFVGDWYVDEFGIPTREVKAHD